MVPENNTCGYDRTKLYNPFKIMTVQSQLIDIDTALPIENAHVYYTRDGEKIGATTNTQGYFTLEATPDDILTFSHVAYGTFDLKANQVQGMEYMQEQVNSLDEVLVVAKKKQNYLWAGLAAIGLFWIVSSGKGDVKKPIKATV